MDNNSSGWIILIAILGAAAWIPHLVQLFLKIITKPRLITVNQKEIEIGFNTLGPIINIGLAFLSEKDKALIQKISLQLKHSSHASHLFLWSWYEESLFQMDFPKVSIPYKKNQTAIALNVAKDFMVEKKIGFQSKEFKEKLDEIGELVNEDYANFKNTNRDLETIKSTKNYNDLVNHFDNSFIWSTRKYTVNIDIYVLKKKNPFKHKLEFELNALNIKKLKDNIPLCKENINNILFTPENSLEQNWQWVYRNDLKDSLNKIKN